MQEKINTGVIFNSQQACLELKIIGYYKIFVMKKYSGQLLSLEQWKEKLQMDGLSV